MTVNHSLVSDGNLSALNIYLTTEADYKLFELESPMPTFLLLARELRDQIYDALLVTVFGEPPQSIPPHLIDVSLGWRPGSGPIDWIWQLPAPRGSCYGLVYSCRQIYAEVLESIERHKGMSFELELAVVGIPHPEARNYMGRDEIWPTWIKLPLCTTPQLFEAPPEAVASQCRNLHVSLKVQSAMKFRWLGSGPGGLSRLTRSLFTMLARFLLYGPLGLHMTPGTSSIWNIDTLSVDVVGAGTTFADPCDGQLCTVPAEIVKDVELHLSDWMDVLCRSGALSNRVRVVRLAVNSQSKRQWSIKEGESLQPVERKEWARYGWIIDHADTTENMTSSVPAAANNGMFNGALRLSCSVCTLCLGPS